MAAEASTFMMESLPVSRGEFGDGIQFHGSGPTRRSVHGLGFVVTSGSVSRGVRGSINPFGGGFSCCEVGRLEHGDKRVDVALEAFDVIVQACTLVHVREFHHEGSEFMVVLVD